MWKGRVFFVHATQDEEKARCWMMSGFAASPHEPVSTERYRIDSMEAIEGEEEEEEREWVHGWDKDSKLGPGPYVTMHIGAPEELNLYRDVYLWNWR